VREYWRKQDCVQIQKRRDTVEAFAANRPLYEACRNSTPLKSRNHAVWWKQVHFSQNDENENVPTNCSFKKKTVGQTGFHQQNLHSSTNTLGVAKLFAKTATVFAAETVSLWE